MVATANQGSLIDRMIRAAKLDPQVYEEVEHDQSATSQAMTVVVLGAVAAASSSVRLGHYRRQSFVPYACILR